MTERYRQFYEDQIRFCETKNLDGLESHYTEDAVLVRYDGPIYGRAAIREFFVGYLDGMPGMNVTSTDKYVEIEDGLAFEATISLDAGVAKVYDAFYFRDGKIHRHFTGLLGFTPKA